VEIDRPDRYAACQGGASAHSGHAPGLGGDPVYRDDGLPVAATTEGLSAGFDRRHYFYRMREDGTFTVINELLSVASRIVEGRNGDPTAAIIDSQSVKTTDSGGVSGYDAGKKINGRKRHVTVDTQGNLLSAGVHGAGIHDRDGAPGIIADTLDSFPGVATIFADGGYAGDKLHCAMLDLEPSPAIGIVRRPSKATGFVVIARRWVIERTFAWLGRCRRLAKDWEQTTPSSEAWLLIAAIRRVARFIARQGNAAAEF
jgi:transposase